MKSIISKLVTLTPIIIIILIVSYVLEELLEDRVSETVSDFVYPIAGLVILGIVWIFLVPVIHCLSSEGRTSNRIKFLSLQREVTSQERPPEVSLCCIEILILLYKYILAS
jgi:uncharacterized membrane protein